MKVPGEIYTIIALLYIIMLQGCIANTTNDTEHLLRQINSTLERKL